MRYRVFLSHSSKDNTWVKWIADNARNSDIDTYLFEYDVQPGTLMSDKIKKEIQSCNALVVLLTYNSQSSPYVHQEIGYADGLHKRIIPLVQPDIQKGTLAMLEGKEYIPFDFSNPMQALTTLLNHLNQLKLSKEKEQDKKILWGIGALIVLALIATSQK